MRSQSHRIKAEHSLAMEAYIQIRNKILKGEISLGQAVSRRGFAAELGMSLVPVAEAMQRLEAEGMIESLPRIGTRVRIPTADDVRDRYIIREALEVQSARLFCERATAAERHELSAMALRLDEMARKNATDDALQFELQSLHVRFHMRIAECTGCVPLYDMLEKNQVLTFNWLCDVATETRMPAHWHADLIKVLSANDPDAAALAMGSHIRSGMSEIQSTIAERYGADLSWIHWRKESLSKNKLPVKANTWRQRRSSSPKSTKSR